MKETEILMAQQTPSFFGPQLILLIGFVAIMYFLIIRPQNKRLKAQKEMINSLSVGDEVIASGGMLCVVTKITDDFVTVRANDTVLTIQREAVTNVLPKGTIKSL
jgi:preprotein translocase subunit YajC